MKRISFTFSFVIRLIELLVGFVKQYCKVDVEEEVIDSNVIEGLQA